MLSPDVPCLALLDCVLIESQHDGVVTQPIKDVVTVLSLLLLLQRSFRMFNASTSLLSDILNFLV